MRVHSSFLKLLGSAALAASLFGCATGPVVNSQGVAAKSIEPGTVGVVSGVGIESQDIVAMTDRMMRDMLAMPALAGRATPPRIVVDAQYFSNDSSQAINRNTITDRLRVNLNRAAAGRLQFVTRELSRMVADERDLKRQGTVDTGTTGLTKAMAGADFRLSGRISTTEKRNQRTGMVQRFNQIVFEMTDLETAVIVWSGLYDFERAAADDVVYR